MMWTNKQTGRRSNIYRFALLVTAGKMEGIHLRVKASNNNIPSSMTARFRLTRAAIVSQ